MGCILSQCSASLLCRSKFGLVVDKCEEMCRLVTSLGQEKDVEAQDLMARLTLDIVLRAGFGMRASYMSDLEPVPLLQELHYAMEESFRYLIALGMRLSSCL